jgi:sugar phosphate isomerase/epimerase
MIGIVKSALPEGRAMTAIEALQATAAHGLEGLLFNTLFEISPSLDPGEMRAVRAEADRLGLTISAGLGFINPTLPSRGAKVIEAGGGDMAAGVRRLIGLAADIGITDMFFVIGMIEDRFETTPGWQAQRDAVAALIRQCGPELRRRGAKLLLKTHEEITTGEVLALVRMVGSDLLGVAYDPVNVVCRMEEPLAAARRVAAHTASVHVDDMVLRFEEGGMRRYLAPIGEGVLDWDATLALMPDARVWIEMHSGQFAMPVFDAAWLAAQPHIVVPEYAAVLAHATRFGARAMPWDQNKPTDRLPQALGKFLK